MGLKVYEQFNDEMKRKMGQRRCRQYDSARPASEHEAGSGYLTERGHQDCYEKREVEAEFRNILGRTDRYTNNMKAQHLCTSTTFRHRS